MKNFYPFFCLLFCISISFSANCQRTEVNNAELPKVIPPPPEVFGIARYGDFNVNLFKGEPDINIPLFTFKSATLSVPISLTYNSGGIKVNDPASSMGLGWTLNAGGVITRVVKGQPDFKKKRKLPVDIRDFAPNSLKVDGRLADTIISQQFDTEPDIFYYSFLGRGGKFVFNTDSQAVVSPFQMLKFSNNGIDNIIDENGIKYTFGHGELSYVEEDCSIGMINPRDFTGLYPSAWYISQIIDPGIDTISFEYERFYYRYEEGNYQTEYIFWFAQSGCTVPNLNRNCTSIRTVHGQRIKKIRSRRNNTYVEFIYDSQQREDFYVMDTEMTYTQNALAKINVYNNAGLIYDIDFTYGYFRSPGYDPGSSAREKALASRLKLLSVTERGKPPYRFYYNEITSLPERLSYRQDHYGYYNAKGNFTTLIPKSDLLVYQGADRSVDSVAAKANILQTIIYPTGGSTKFDYESNVVKTKQTKYTTITRIKNLTLSSPRTFKVDSFIVKDSNHIFNMNFTVSYSVGDRGQVYLNGPDDRDRGVFSASGSGTNIPLSNLAPGKYYMEIENIWDGGSGNVTFRVQYVEGRIDTIGYFNELRGGLRIRKILNYTDSLTTFANGKRYEYNFPNTTDSSSLYDLRRLKYESNFRKKSQTYDGSGDYTLCFYKVLSSNPVPYLNNDYENFYGYQYVTVYNDTLGKLGKTQYKFSVQLKDMDFDSAGFRNNRFVDWGRGNILEKKDYSFDAGTNNFSLVRTEINRYKAYYDANDFWAPYLGIKYPNKHEVFVPAISMREFPPGGLTAVPNYDPSYPYLPPFDYPRYEVENYFVSSAWFHKWRDTVTTYGQFGNGSQTQITDYFYENPNQVALTRTESLDSRGLLMKITYKYPHDLAGSGAVYDSMVARNKIAPVVEKREFQAGTLLSQVKTNFGLLYANTIINPTLVQTAQYNNPLVTQLSYDLYDNKGNILQYTSKSGVPNSYVWGYNQTYPVAKIIGASYSDVLLALGQTDQQLSYLQNLNDNALLTELDKLRNNLKTIRPFAQVATYTFIPLVGMSSERDANNNATYYEFDSSNRLKRIKDKDGNIIKEFDYRDNSSGGSQLP